MNAVIIVPCYNEAGRLDLQQFKSFTEHHRDFTFLFVNDGSSDDTGRMLEKFCNATAHMDFLNLDKNHGKAEAVRLGILRAMERQSDFIGFCDADLATPLDELADMLALANKQTLFVSGCRLKRLGSTVSRKLIRHLIGRFFATAVSIHLDLPVYDTQCGAKLYNRELTAKVFQRTFVTKWCFDVEILRRLITLHGREKVITDSLEYPLHCWIDKSGSKLRIFPALADFLRLLFSQN